MGRGADRARAVGPRVGRELLRWCDQTCRQQSAFETYVDDKDWDNASVCAHVSE
ncbi:hypothetical protein GCM10010222_12910 [Streptomyces tanashiensis]|nr:hypothetical protein GCM10010222_12910 [Streptomyces tanashiensis]